MIMFSALLLRYDGTGLTSVGDEGNAYPFDDIEVIIAKGRYDVK